MARIFISYRRGPAEPIAAELARRLRSYFRGRRIVFIDRDELKPGDRWEERLDEALARCEVLIPIIGPGWAEEFGHRDPESDWVRREVRSALECGRPVLIIPVLIGGARMPSEEDLPEGLLGLLDHQGYSVVNDASGLPPDEQADRIKAATAAACRAIGPRIDAHLGEGPTGKLGFGIFSLPPRRANSDGFEFRYRRVRTLHDLEPFVKLSDAEADIAAQNPGLEDENRRKLYSDWCEWTKDRDDLPWDHAENRVRSFLMLDRSAVTRDGQGHAVAHTPWETIGVSILLPLSDEGERFLTRPADGVEAKASRLEEWHIQRQGSSCFLLDTLIIAKKFPGKKFPGKESVPRMEHHHWGTMLPLRQLAQFWRPQPTTLLDRLWNGFKQRGVTFLVEPDNYRLDDALAHDIGFEKVDRGEESGPILILHYPSRRMISDPEYARKMKALLKGLRALKRIEIV